MGVPETEAEILSKIKKSKQRVSFKHGYEAHIKVEEAKLQLMKITMKIFDLEILKADVQDFIEGVNRIEPSLSDIGHGSDAFNGKKRIIDTRISSNDFDRLKLFIRRR